jgi:DNA sulfur modification protein DndD
MFQLLSSQKIYNKIEITEDYEVKLLDLNWVYQTNLSAWQSQILMTSLLWWLEKLSDFQLPVIIDTPLARLDPIHRNNMLEKYFHNAWWQVIILSQPSEITKEDKNNELFSRYLKNNSYISMTFDEDKMQSFISIKPIS